jgi:signal transduction histidine kinase
MDIAPDRFVLNIPQKILVVDGDEILLRYLPLRFEDCAVLTARDPGAALGLLESHPDVSVLLADPQASGIPLLEFCRARFPRMPQVLMTRGAAGVPLGHAFRTINKPCRETDLVQALRQALAQAQSGAAPPPQPPLLGEVLEARLAEQTQALRDRTHELEAINRMKDELVMIAAHDIRAPLSVILGYTDILLESEPAISANGQSILTRIHAAANRLLSMVNNLLNLAAVEEGKVQLTLAPVRMSSVIADVLESLGGMLDEQQVRCNSEILGPDGEFMIDRGRLEQVLQNLLTNAVKFNRKGGTVHISAATAGDRLHFSVRDSGKGFTPDQAQRAFTKFSRFSAGDSPGSGLGLAIAKAFVQLHGGEIWLESHAGDGTTFHFTIVPGFKPSDRRPVLPT